MVSPRFLAVKAVENFIPHPLQRKLKLTKGINIICLYAIATFDGVGAFPQDQHLSCYEFLNPINSLSRYAEKCHLESWDFFD